MTDNKLLQAVLDKITALDQKVTKGFAETNRRIDDTKGGLTARIDKLGLQIANLEDDAPTVEEFDKLEKRVTKIENDLSKN